MFSKQTSQVAVVGGGPVGLMTALFLTESGVGVEVYDENWRTAAHSYALALHPRSLEQLDELGLANDLIPQGRSIHRVAFYDGESRKAEMDLSKLESRFPFVLVLPQSLLEGALEERLAARRVKIHWNHRILEVQSARDGVTLSVARMQKETRGYPVAHTEWVVGKEFPVRAEYVAGADGYNSFLRRALDFEFADLGNRILLSVFEFPTDASLADEVRVFLNADATNLLWPMAGGRCRWSFQIPADHPEALTLDRLHTALRQRAPWFEPVPQEVGWSSVVQFEHRLVERFGRDRIWLAGDAAHLTHPIGAQSMNAGLVEAKALAHALTRVLRDHASPELLEDYGAERAREWGRLLGLGTALPSSPTADPWVNDRRHRILSSVPATGAHLDALLSQIGLTLKN